MRILPRIVGLSLSALTFSQTPVTVGVQAPKPPVASPARADAASRAKAVSILARAREAAGGVKNLQAVRDFSRTLELTQTNGGMKATQTQEAIYPGTLRLVNSIGPLGQGKVTAYFDVGGTGWMKSPVAFDARLPPWQMRAAQQDLMRPLEWLLLSDLRGERSVAFIERREVQGRLSDGVEISDKDAGTLRLWLEVKSGDPVALQYRRVGPKGDREQIVDYFSDFFALNGVRTPRKISTKSDGQPYMESLVTRLEYNQGLQQSKLSAVPETPPAEADQKKQ